MTTSTGPGRGIKKLITDDGASLQLCSAAVLQYLQCRQLTAAMLGSMKAGLGLDVIVAALLPGTPGSMTASHHYSAHAGTRARGENILAHRQHSYSWDVTLNMVSLSRAVIVVTSSL